MRVKFTSINNTSTRIALILCLSASMGVANAADKPTLQEVARQLVCQCPDCGKQTVDQCAPGCGEGKHIREEIGAGIKEGKTAAQIIDFIVQKHGEQMRAAPQATGFGAAAYWLPAIGVVAGLLPLSLILRSRRKNEIAGGTSNGAPRVASTQNGGAEDPRVAAALKEIDF